MEKEILDFVPFCKNEILEHIDNYEDEQVYACDLAYELTQGMNCDGSFTYSNELAKDYIKEWWDDCAAYSDYENDHFGERHNPFENPEAFLVCMVIEGVAAIMSQLPTISDNWNDKLTLTKETIDSIKEELEDVDDYNDVF